MPEVVTTELVSVHTEPVNEGALIRFSGDTDWPVLTTLEDLAVQAGLTMDDTSAYVAQLGITPDLTDDGEPCLPGAFAQTVVARVQHMRRAATAMIQVVGMELRHDGE